MVQQRVAFFLSHPVYRLGSGPFSRDGRVTGNKHIFLLGSKHNCIRTQALFLSAHKNTIKTISLKIKAFFGGTFKNNDIIIIICKNKL